MYRREYLYRHPQLNSHAIHVLQALQGMYCMAAELMVALQVFTPVRKVLWSVPRLAPSLKQELSSSSRVLGPHKHKQEALLHLQHISNMFSVD